MSVYLALGIIAAAVAVWLLIWLGDCALRKMFEWHDDPYERDL